MKKPEYEETTEGMYEQLIQLANEVSDLEFGREVGNSDIGDQISAQNFFRKRLNDYRLSGETGRSFYESLTDEQLLNVLRQQAVKLNHSPSKKEVFWVFRDYIKMRFKKWPYALKQAGLDKSAGTGGKTLERSQQEKKELEDCLKEIEVCAKKLGRIPHPKDLPLVCEKMKKYVSTWGEAIEQTNVDENFFEEQSVYQIEDLETIYKDYLSQIYEKAVQLNRAPLKHEIDEDVRKQLIVRCKNWRNVLHQIHLEPVMRIRPFSNVYIDYRSKESEKKHQESLYDCYYKLLVLDEQTKTELGALKKIYMETGKVPEKQQVSLAERKHLQKVCGSWSNGLYQIDLKK